MRQYSCAPKNVSYKTVCLVLDARVATAAIAAPVEQNQARQNGLSALVDPVVMGAANPLETGVGRGVAGAAGGTQQVTDLLGDAVAELFHVATGVAANTEQGAGVAVANAAPAVQGTVEAVQNNNGALGDAATILGG
ncbi:hypothetical protein NLG97_g3005 [Lecanicillium saksenae]|uniref:Uncharacterized protein n=1 Tax=Lecanicillium saksenae TaxID=468837 RepID=A0ACC1R2K7_9HYPO|nr:hypothetical protein NLG97_g3005 [Lecanicillium saksenae]